MIDCLVPLFSGESSQAGQPNCCILGDPLGGPNEKVTIQGYRQINVKAKEAAFGGTKSLAIKLMNKWPVVPVQRSRGEIY